MKKNYIVPKTTVVKIRVQALVAASVVEIPTDPNTPGTPGARYFGDAWSTEW